MEKIIKKKIGKEVHVFTIAGDNLFDVVMKSKKLSFPDVEKCDLCGCEDLELSAHIAKNKFKYTTIRCKNFKCKGSLNFGQQTEDPDTFYLKYKEGDGGKKVLDWKKPEDQD